MFPVNHVKPLTFESLKQTHRVMCLSHWDAARRTRF